MAQARSKRQSQNENSLIHSLHDAQWTQTALISRAEYRGQGMLPWAVMIVIVIVCWHADFQGFS